jgi:inner membrane protein
MDTVTQALLGATVGQAVFGRVLGPRALVWGAVGGLLPDLDIAASAVDPMGEWLYHRGPTHALWFGPVVGPILGVAAARALEHRRPSSTAPEAERRRAWIGLFVLSLFTHPLLDVFTTYGTQLLAPFSDRRFAYDAIGIIDPAYSILLILALVVGLRAGPASPAARVAALSALALSSAYVGYCRHLNLEAERVARDRRPAELSASAGVRAYPTLFQPWLRRVVAREGAQICVGWLSLWGTPEPQWDCFATAGEEALEAARASREVRVFEWFAMGETATRVTAAADGSRVVEIDDIRYGFPGAPADGLWGVRVEIDAQGVEHGPARRYERPLPMPAGELMAQLIRLAFG